MWTAIASLLAALLKMVFEIIAKKKLNDNEFLAHVEMNQKRRQGAGKTANDFETAMAEAAAQAEAPTIPKEETKDS